MAALMKDAEEIKALGEWWYPIIYIEDFYSDKKTPVPKEYLAIRAKEAGQTVEEMKLRKLDGDIDDDIYVNKWEEKLTDKDKGPDRCLKGHALHYCKGTAILVLDENDGSSYNTMNSGPCMWKHCLKL